MRISIVAHGLSGGGAERVASLVANDYAKKGHEVLFIAVYSPEKVYTLDGKVSYEYIGGGNKNRLTKWIYRTLRIDKAVRDFHSDVVVSFIINELLVTCIRSTAPVIYSLRIDPAREFDTLGYRAMGNFAYNRAKKVVFQTPGARDFFPQRIRDKGVVIANPLTKGLPRWNASGCEKSVVTACRLNEQKNLPMLISAFAAFHETHREYTLKIYGDGELLDSLKQYAEKCGVADSVFFPGYARNIHEIMANSAIFALTSDYEGLSNSMLEALAIGVPTVCTDCPPGGAALYIKDGINGMLVPVGDRVELSKRLCRLAEDKELCLRMSEESRKIQEELDVDRVLKQWEAVLCRE